MRLPCLYTRLPKKCKKHANKTFNMVVVALPVTRVSDVIGGWLFSDTGGGPILQKTIVSTFLASSPLKNFTRWKLFFLLPQKHPTTSWYFWQHPKVGRLVESIPAILPSAHFPSFLRTSSLSLTILPANVATCTLRIMLFQQP